jgi:hypothetical protein
MLHSNNFKKVNLWPRGVDLSQFSPSKRSATLRAEWGVGCVPTTHGVEVTSEPLVVKGIKRMPTIFEDKERDMGLHYQGRKASLPLTPPESPDVGPGYAGETIDEVISLEPAAISSALAALSRGAADSDPSLSKRVVLLFVGRM